LPGHPGKGFFVGRVIEGEGLMLAVTHSS
jgi:hypothetical protein